jgi:integrase
MRRDQSGNKSVYQVTRALEADLLPAWRGKQIDKITKLDVIALLDSITDRGAPAMARRVQSYVNRFFAWCLERDILKVSPVTGMARVGENVTRERVLDDKELKAVWHGADSIGSYGSAVKMLVLTGARREEISALKWSEIKGNEIVLENGRTKNGKRHTIPLSHAAMRLLESLPKIGESEYVFTITGKRPLAAWSKPKIELDGASGVTDWRIHDLRRTCATGMQKLGVNLQTIEAVLNHISGSRDGVVGIYQRHSFDAEKREALEKWGECVNRLVG